MRRAPAQESDMPIVVWATGALFLGVGALFVVGPLGGFTNASGILTWHGALSMGLGLLSAVVGGGILWTTPRVTIRIDGHGRTVEVSAGWFRGTRRRIEISHIAEVLVAEKPDGEGGWLCQPQLVLKSGERVGLSRAWVSWRRPSERLVARVGERLASAGGDGV